MNRLATPKNFPAHWPELMAAAPSHAVGAALAERSVRPAADVPSASFLPVNYEPAYAYPLIVWLHDSAASERHLPQVMQHISTQNFVAVAPRAPVRRKRDTAAQPGFYWVQRPEEIAAAEEAVDEAIALAEQRFHIHPERVFLLGHGEGGTMALRVGLQRPHRFAGVATCNGHLPRTYRPLRQLKRLRELPFFVASTREHPRYREQQVCRDLRLLHSAGCSVSLRQYPGDDDLTTTMLADVNRWIMDRVCEATACR